MDNLTKLSLARIRSPHELAAAIMTEMEQFLIPPPLAILPWALKQCEDLHSKGVDVLLIQG